MPLLHVGPGGFARDGNERQRRCTARKGAGIKIRISHYIHNAAGLGVDVVGLERLGISFVAVGMLEEDSVTAADRPFPVTERIIGKTKARRGIPPMIGHAAL